MSRIWFRSFFAILTAIAVGVFLYTLVTAVWYSPSGEVASSTLERKAPAAHANASSLPSRLIIPALKIDATVQKVGLKADSSMATPNNFTDVAWYKYGTIPGQVGSAVIDGHVDNGLSLAGVFKHLIDIKIGDDVYVQEANGEQLHFVVTDIQTYPYKGAPDEKIFTQTDAARLNLITCEGVWVPSGRTYDHRLVVFTKLVSG